MNRSAVIIIILLALWGCRKEVNIDLDDRDKKIVLNSILSQGDPILVNLSLSKGILEDDYPMDYIENGLVILSKNGVAIDTLSHDSNGNYISKFQPETAIYEIDVWSPQYNKVHTSTEIPSPVSISSIDTASVTGYEQRFDFTYEYQALECRLKITDPPNETNFYLLSVENEVHDSLSGIFKLPVYYRSPDPVLASDKNNYVSLPGGDYGALFTDEIFNGTTYRLVIHVERYAFMEGYNKMVFKLHSLNRELFLYLKSLELYNQSKFGAFSEPVQVYSNIENGFGIFCGYSTSSNSIEFDYTWDGGMYP